MVLSTVSGEDGTIPWNDVADVQPGATSLMPPGFADVLTRFGACRPRRVPARGEMTHSSLPRCCGVSAPAAVAERSSRRPRHHFSNTPDGDCGTLRTMRLDGRVAVVTGGTKGVGRGVARELARVGAQVFATGRSVPDHEPFDEPVTAIRCDHRDDSQVDAAFDRLAREATSIDLLVNSVWAGYEGMVENGEFTWPKPFWQQPLWRWDAMFAAGVRAHYHAEPAGRAQHGGATTRIDREHLILGSAEARRKRRLWCLESGNRQDDIGHVHGTQTVRRRRGLPLPGARANREGHGGSTIPGLEQFRVSRLHWPGSCRARHRS